jgi:hypothetical protein
MKLSEFCAQHKIKKHVEAGLQAHLRCSMEQDLAPGVLTQAYADFMGRPLPGSESPALRTPPPSAIAGLPDGKAPAELDTPVGESGVLKDQEKRKGGK